MPGADGSAVVASSADAELAFSGTSILSPSRSQKSGDRLACEQSTTHSRACPLAASRRVTLARERSEEVSTSLDWRRTGLSQKGAWATIVGSRHLLPPNPPPCVSSSRLEICGARVMFVACPLMTISTHRVRHFFRFANAALEKPSHFSFSG